MTGGGAPSRLARGEGDPPARWVFAQDFAVVARPYEHVAAQLRTRADAVMRHAMTAARAQGADLQGRVGPGSWPAALAPAVEVRPRPARASTGGLVLGFDWESSDRPSLLQRLEGDLEAAPFGATESQLALRCRYQPPADLVLRRADELLLHRLVESTLRAFLRGICAAIG